jgi:hypothetical protein
MITGKADFPFVRQQRDEIWDMFNDQQREKRKSGPIHRNNKSLGDILWLAV